MISLGIVMISVLTVSTMLIIAIIIEKNRGFSLKNILTVNEDGWRNLTMFSFVTVILFYSVYVTVILGYLVYLIIFNIFAL